MTEKTQRAMALAAASVLGLSLGMVALPAAADQPANGQTSNQIKNGVSNQHKADSNFLKTPTNQIKGETNLHKTPTGSNQIKMAPGSNQIKFWNNAGSNQIKGESNFHKLPTGSNQIKNQTPSPELNPQPEPPMQTPPKPDPTTGNQPH